MSKKCGNFHKKSILGEILSKGVLRSLCMSGMLKLVKITVLILTAFCLSFSAFADKFNTETSSSTRALGMGNAGVNTERGPYAVFYNPANLAAKDTKLHFQIVNFQFEGNEGLAALSGSGNSANFSSLSSLYAGLKTQKNTYAGGRFSVFPNITFRNLSFGLLYELNQGAENRAYDGKLRIRARDRFAPTLGLAFRMFKGVFRFGASAQYLTVGDADTTTGPTINEKTLDFKKFINAGSGFNFTAGSTLTFPVRFLPSFSVVMRNIGNTRFSGPAIVGFGEKAGPPDQEMTVDFGSSLTVYLARRLESKLTFDYRDFTNQMSGQRLRHAFAGMEFSFYDVIKLRGGLSHGYLTGGVGLHTPNAALEFAVYSDEKDDRLRGSRDTRFVMQYSWGLFK